eukprot:12155114-Ditylum_brightwellii.AAC.1
MDFGELHLREIDADNESSIQSSANNSPQTIERSTSLEKKFTKTAGQPPILSTHGSYNEDGSTGSTTESQDWNKSQPIDIEALHMTELNGGYDPPNQSSMNDARSAALDKNFPNIAGHSAILPSLNTSYENGSIKESKGWNSPKPIGTEELYMTEISRGMNPSMRSVNIPARIASRQSEALENNTPQKTEPQPMFSNSSQIYSYNSQPLDANELKMKEISGGPNHLMQSPTDV